ncbi:ead/Ea22-like family protein [Serratia marcescens]|uniref:ead/Ea22-like family protein n=1 Tax=Serratia marcescens TaxID=615 RepID=UPI0029DC70BD|nr:ead/Ea22-like family protein [Serratia marcescens]MDX6800904.1 ead/Ea22-like family protein [Serratia marcescens]
MDKFSEMKRMAEKCPVQRFEPFIGRAGGRGTQAIFNADTKDEVITWSGFDSSNITSRTGREAIARFVAAVDPETVLALLAELEAKDKRIAELETHNARLREWNAGLAQESCELQAKLATPVRLPGKTSALDIWDGGWDACLEECAEAIRAAGYKVEGDE